MKIIGGNISIAAIVCSVIVGVVAHLLTGVRDKRARNIKDCNEAADILAGILRKEQSDPIYGNDIDFSAFRRVLSGKELIRFDRCVEEYRQAKKNTPIDNRIDSGSLCRAGSTSYQDTNSIIAAIDELLKFTNRK